MTSLHKATCLGSRFLILSALSLPLMFKLFVIRNPAHDCSCMSLIAVDDGATSASVSAANKLSYAVSGGGGSGRRSLKNRGGATTLLMFPLSNAEGADSNGFDCNDVTGGIGSDTAAACVG